MARALMDCHACACLIDLADSICPFCGAAQRRGLAPSWTAATLICGLGVASVACDVQPIDEPLEAREQFVLSTGTTTGGTTTGGPMTGGTTTGTTTSTTTFGTGDSFPDASTYAGPAETDTIGTTTVLTTGGSTSTTTLGTSDSFPDGSTYAGPDETSTIPTTGTPQTTDPTGTSDPSTGGTTSGGTTSGEIQPDDPEGCGCSSEPRPLRGGLLGALGLLALSRRRARRAR